MKHYLMVDIGTGSTRVAITDSAGTILAIKGFFNSYYRDNAYSDAQYFFPEEWENEIFRCCKELHAENPDIVIDAVSASGARESIILVDKSGFPYICLPNIDNRGRDFMDEIDEKAEIYKRSGKWVTEDFCAAKLYGYKKLYPEEFEKISTLLSLSDWVGYIFTGVAFCEPSQACETQLYDIGTKQWSEYLCNKYGVNISSLPPLMAAGTIAGKIKSNLVSSFGMSEDAVFIVGGADTQCALFQTGIGKGDIAIVSGTTSPVVTLTEEKYYDPEQRVWTDLNLGADGYVIEMNPGVTGLNYQRVKDNLCPDISYSELEKAYSEKKEFFCTACFSSLLFYEQRSIRKGGFFSASPYNVNLDRIDMAWAVLADIACATYEELYRLVELTGCDRDYVLCCGGGFQSPTLCRMLADLSGMEVRIRPGFEQATVSGLVAICNECFGIESVLTSSDITIYKPRKNQLIHSYHPVWSENRLTANKKTN